MNADELRQWVDNHDIVNRTIQKFWSSFKEFMNEGWTENNPFALFDEDKLTVDIEEISLKLKEYSKAPHNTSSEVIEAHLNLNYFDSPTGHYHITYDLLGNEICNGLEWGLFFVGVNQRLSILEDLKSEFENNSVKEILDRESIEAIKNIIDNKQEEIRAAFKGKWRMSDDGLFISHIR